jgi:hypothetical protein
MCLAKSLRVHHNHIMMQIIKSTLEIDSIFKEWTPWSSYWKSCWTYHALIILYCLFKMWHTVKYVLANDLAKSDNTHINITQPEPKFLDENQMLRFNDHNVTELLGSNRPQNQTSTLWHNGHNHARHSSEYISEHDTPHANLNSKRM